MPRPRSQRPNAERPLAEPSPDPHPNIERTAEPPPAAAARPEEARAKRSDGTLVAAMRPADEARAKRSDAALVAETPAEGVRAERRNGMLAVEARPGAEARAGREGARSALRNAKHARVERARGGARSARSAAPRARVVAVGAVAAGAVAALAACTGDDEIFRPAPSYLYDASIFDRGASPGEVADASAALTCGDAGGAPPRVLAIDAEHPELAALNLDTHAVDGRFVFADAGAVAFGSISAANADPWLVDRDHDRVIRLDPREPWKPLATWDVHGSDGTGTGSRTGSGSDGSARPVAVVQVSCTKAYVLRANRERIAIIDPSLSRTDGGLSADTWLDLAAHRPKSGSLALTAAVWVPAKQRIFVLAGNVDRTATTANGLRCTTLKPTIFGIDVTTDTVVSTTELTGYAPPEGSSFLYDASFDRLIALSAGCYAIPDGGGALRPQRRVVEQVDLATGAVKTLLSLDTNASAASDAGAPEGGTNDGGMNDGGMNDGGTTDAGARVGDLAPTALALADGTRAIVVFGHSASFWNPAQPELGPAIAGGLDRITVDSHGSFIGTRAGDGGLEVIALSVEADGGALFPGTTTTLGTALFSKPSTSTSSLETWPHR